MQLSIASLSTRFNLGTRAQTPAWTRNVILRSKQLKINHMLRSSQSDDNDLINFGNLRTPMIHVLVSTRPRNEPQRPSARPPSPLHSRRRLYGLRRNQLWSFVNVKVEWSCECGAIKVCHNTSWLYDVIKQSVVYSVSIIFLLRAR